MFALATKEAGAADWIVRYPGEYKLEFFLAGARTSSAQLLNEGTYHHEGGYSGKDRTGTLEFITSDRAVQQVVEGWHRNRTALKLSIDEGVFDITTTTCPGKEGTVKIGFRVDAVAGLSVDIAYPTNDTPAPVTGAWVEKTDDTYWSAYQSSVTWSGTQWEAVYDGVEEEWKSPLRLEVNGVWNLSYRPTKVRLTYTAASTSWNFKMRDSWNSDLNVDVDGYESAVEANLTFFEPGDIDRLYLSFIPGIDAALTKIEFWEPA